MGRFEVIIMKLCPSTRADICIFLNIKNVNGSAQHIGRTVIARKMCIIQKKSWSWEKCVFTFIVDSIN